MKRSRLTDRLTQLAAEYRRYGIHPVVVPIRLAVTSDAAPAQPRGYSYPFPPDATRGPRRAG